MRFIVLLQENDGAVHAFARTEAGEGMEIAELGDLITREESVDVPLLDHYLWNSSNAALVDPHRAQDPGLATHIRLVLNTLTMIGRQAERERTKREDN